MAVTYRLPVGSVKPLFYGVTEAEIIELGEASGEALQYIDSVLSNE